MACFQIGEAGEEPANVVPCGSSDAHVIIVLITR